MKNLYELKEGDPIYLFSKYKCKIYKFNFSHKYYKALMGYWNEELGQHIKIDLSDETYKPSWGYCNISHIEYGEKILESCDYSADKDFIIQKAIDYKKNICKNINKTIKEIGAQ